MMALQIIQAITVLYHCCRNNRVASCLRGILRRRASDEAWRDGGVSYLACVVWLGVDMIVRVINVFFLPQLHCSLTGNLWIQLIMANIRLIWAVTVISFVAVTQYLRRA